MIQVGVLTYRKTIIDKSIGTCTVMKGFSPTVLLPGSVGPLPRILILAAFFLVAVRGFAVDPLDLDIAIQGVTRARSPLLVSDVVVFSYLSERPTRFVGARFAHEGYTILHPYSRNESGVFVMDYPLPEGLRELRYRIVVDGLWMSDPENPSREPDALGNEISLFTVEKEPARPPVNPKREADGRLTFVFRGQPGRKVSLTGDFNDWDPFIDYLSETEPGLYALSIRVRTGRHYYYFFIDGRRILDIYNSRTAEDPSGNVVSSFLAP